jgi:hypothetical protein
MHQTPTYQKPTVQRFGTFRELTLKQDMGFDLAMSDGCESSAQPGSMAACTGRS